MDGAVTVTVPEPLWQLGALGQVPLKLTLLVIAAVVYVPPRATTKLPSGKPLIWSPPAYGSLDGTENVILSPLVSVIDEGVKYPPEPHDAPLVPPVTATVLACAAIGANASTITAAAYHRLRLMSFYPYASTIIQPQL